MKVRTVHFAILIALLLSLPALVQAQMATKDPLFRINVPFAFMAGGVNLPPGEYLVYHPGNPYFLVIQDKVGRARAMAYVHPLGTRMNESTTKLVFNKYGDQYFLSQVWTQADQEVHQCFKCYREKELMARSEKPDTVAIPAQ